MPWCIDINMKKCVYCRMGKFMPQLYKNVNHIFCLGFFNKLCVVGFLRNFWEFFLVPFFSQVLSTSQVCDSLVSCGAHLWEVSKWPLTYQSCLMHYHNFKVHKTMLLQWQKGELMQIADQRYSDNLACQTAVLILLFASILSNYMDARIPQHKPYFSSFCQILKLKQKTFFWKGVKFQRSFCHLFTEKIWTEIFYCVCF